MSRSQFKFGPYSSQQAQGAWRALGASQLFLTAGIVLLGVFCGLSASSSMENYPEIPTIDADSTARVLAASGFCRAMAEYIEGQNKSIHVTPTDTSTVLVVLSNKAPALAIEYSSFDDLKTHVTGARNLNCNGGTAVYIYRAANGVMYRSFKSSPHCAASENAGVVCGGAILSPGYISVQFRIGRADEGRERLSASYDLHAFMKTEVIGHSDETYYTISVDVGSEEAWVRFLKRLPEVAEASRARLELAAVDSQGLVAEYEALNRQPRVPVLPASTRATTTVERAVEFFKQDYLSKADVIILKKSEKRVSIMIDGLRGEVLPAEGFWEVLLVNCVFSEDRQKTEFFINTTGRYAGGIGSIRPSKESYSDMDRDYFEQLQKYSDELTTALQTYLGG
ncbi:hypothetical protein [Mesorhizobium sp. M0088]|uniref:hypothetical protein n=1 Tax=Mesorhizobium sp. M0088 TaxID=2956873 RepID=UPI003336C8EC